MREGGLHISVSVGEPGTREIDKSSLSLFLNFTLFPFWVRNNNVKYHPKRINPHNPITYFLFYHLAYLMVKFSLTLKLICSLLVFSRQKSPTRLQTESWREGEQNISKWVNGVGSPVFMLLCFNEVPPPILMWGISKNYLPDGLCKKKKNNTFTM